MSNKLSVEHRFSIEDFERLCSKLLVCSEQPSSPSRLPFQSTIRSVPDQRKVEGFVRDQSVSEDLYAKLCGKGKQTRSVPNRGRVSKRLGEADISFHGLHRWLLRLYGSFCLLRILRMMCFTTALTSRCHGCVNCEISIPDNFKLSHACLRSRDCT